MSRGRVRGTTLVELIVGMFVLSLLVGGIYLVAVNTVKDYMVESATVELEQASLSALGRLTLEMDETDPSGVSTATSPQGVVFVSPRTSTGGVTYDSSGSLNWQRYVCYYVRTVNGVSSLVRAEESLTTPTSTMPSLSGKTPSYFSTKTYKIVAANVSSLTVGVDNPATVSLTIYKTALGNDNQMQVSTSIWLRN